MSKKANRIPGVFNPDISYEHCTVRQFRSGKLYKVYHFSRHIGYIVKTLEGKFQFMLTSDRDRGSVFSTEKEVKMSIEGK